MCSLDQNSFLLPYLHLHQYTMAAVPEVELKKTAPAVEKAEMPEEKGLSEDAYANPQPKRAS